MTDRPHLQGSTPDWVIKRDREHVCPDCHYIGPAKQCACFYRLAAERDHYRAALQGDPDDPPPTLEEIQPILDKYRRDDL